MKKLLLTGGTGDIGNSIRLEFEKQGFEVISPARQELDLSESKNIDNYFHHNNHIFDSFVHCAGYNDPYPFEKLTLSDINITMQINTFSFFQIMKHLSQMLRKNKGNVVAISSLYGSVGRDGRAAYVMSKHALNGLVKTLALEFGSDNVLINTVSPGFVDTQMTQKNNTKERIQFLAQKTALGRLSQMDEIAKVVYFLCSENNTYITGQDIIVDGGFIVGGHQK
ncbi:MAG: SDR family NAD(P)-dependent oxidoreductase [Brevinemataceae bacterium]